MTKLTGEWFNEQNMQPREYTCGFCGMLVSSSKGWGHRSDVAKYRIAICPNCVKPTFFDDAMQVPAPQCCKNVKHLPDDIASLFDEAQGSYAANAFTGSVLLSRKLLMNVAVNNGAKEGESFQAYVDFLASKGIVPSGGKTWVDKVRTKGNEATHQVERRTQKEALLLLRFLEMILRTQYEYPKEADEL